MMTILSLFLSLHTFAAVYKTDKLEVAQVLKPGDTYIYTPKNFSITLEKIQKNVSECAVPGFNCGAGYHPEPTYTPILKTVSPKHCENSKIIPLDCDVIQLPVNVDKEKSASFKFVHFLSYCETQDNADNKRSCFINAIKNRYDRAPYDPSFCERIDGIEGKDACYEAIADKVQDHQICDKMKGNMGFQCIMLKAEWKKDPAICKGLKKGPRHYSDDVWKSEIASCLERLKHLK